MLLWRALVPVVCRLRLGSSGRRAGLRTEARRGFTGISEPCHHYRQMTLPHFKYASEIQPLFMNFHINVIYYFLNIIYCHIFYTAGMARPGTWYLIKTYYLPMNTHRVSGLGTYSVNFRLSLSSVPYPLCTITKLNNVNRFDSRIVKLNSDRRGFVNARILSRKDLWIS